MVDKKKHEQSYLAWWKRSEHGLEGIGEKNWTLLRQYFQDMACGRNIAKGSMKGRRSFCRLNTLRTRLLFCFRHLELSSVVDIGSCSEDAVHDLFHRMRTGQIVKRNGEAFRGTGSYVKVFKAFWHWHMRVSLKQRGQTVLDICEDIDDQDAKPPWVYLTHEHVQQLYAHALPRYRALLMLLFDSGARSPSEVFSIRVRDLSNDCRRLHIREETSKTIGRHINLVLAPRDLQLHITQYSLGPNDGLFTMTPAAANKYLKRLARKVLGTEVTKARSRYSELTMYDFRHSSACFWRRRYKTEAELMYRFGWVRSERIRYYTEFLGVRDTASAESVLADEEVAVVVRERDQARNDNEQLRSDLARLTQELGTIRDTVRQLAQASRS